MSSSIFSIEYFDRNRYFKNANIWQRRYHKHKTNEPQCFCCTGRLYRRFEDHHVAKRCFHKLIILVCVNCHDTLTDWQSSWPPQISTPPSKHEIHGRLKLGAADILQLAAFWLVYAQSPNDKIEGSGVTVHELSQLYHSIAIAIRKSGLSLLRQAYDIENSSPRNSGRKLPAKSKDQSS